MENAPCDMSGSQFYSDISGPLRNYLAEHVEYTGMFFGLGGRGLLKHQLREHSDKFRNNWIFHNWEEFLSKANVFPDELWTEIERRIIEALGKASAVRITDPEGTFIEYPLTAEEAKIWSMTAWLPGHLILDILHSTSQERAKVSAKVPPVFRDLNGVLAGTSNHQGFIPRIQLYFEHGRLVEVEGGGKYGDLIRDMMDKYRDVHWPGYPDLVSACLKQTISVPHIGRFVLVQARRGLSRFHKPQHTPQQNNAQQYQRGVLPQRGLIVDLV